MIFSIIVALMIKRPKENLYVHTRIYIYTHYFLESERPVKTRDSSQPIFQRDPSPMGCFQYAIRGARKNPETDGSLTSSEHSQMCTHLKIKMNQIPWDQYCYVYGKKRVNTSAR